MQLIGAWKHHWLFPGNTCNSLPELFLLILWKHRQEGAGQAALGTVSHRTDGSWWLMSYFSDPSVMLTRKCVLHCIPESPVALSPSCPYWIIDLMTFPFPLLVSFISLIHFPSPSQQCLWDHLPTKPLVLYSSQTRLQEKLRLRCYSSSYFYKTKFD